MWTLPKTFTAKACQKSATSSLSNSPILARGELGLEDEVGPPAQIDRAGGQRLVHRQREVAVAADAGAVAQRLPHRQAETDADVLDRVVLIDVQVAVGLDLQVDRGVLGQQREHVVEEADARGDLRAAAAVEIDFQADVGLRRLALDGGSAGHNCV